MKDTVLEYSNCNFDYLLFLHCCNQNIVYIFPFSVLVCDVICNLPLVHLKVFVSQLFRKLSRRFRNLKLESSRQFTKTSTQRNCKSQIIIISRESAKDIHFQVEMKVHNTGRVEIGRKIWLKTKVDCDKN